MINAVDKIERIALVIRVQRVRWIISSLILSEQLSLQTL